ncbi:hypothetical protein [Pseudomonas syringae]|uniref:hypothetical protein n=1 Tax=Pseudomonas syringae TaxID=317 RepID=UPI0015E19997|nr:hypothetical protein [Pseudomonas syringae]
MPSFKLCAFINLRRGGLGVAVEDADLELFGVKAARRVFQQLNIFPAIHAIAYLIHRLALLIGWLDAERLERNPKALNVFVRIPFAVITTAKPVSVEPSLNRVLYRQHPFLKTLTRALRMLISRLGER